MLLAGLLAVLFVLPACDFLMDEFFTLQQPPPDLDLILEQMGDG